MSQMSQLPDSKTTPKVRIILCVRGGVADLMYKPKGTEVIIFDYDVDGSEPTDRDPDGNPCCIQSFAAHHKVQSQKHWPLVRTAVRNVNDHQRWRCPQCRRTAHSSDESLAESGTPYCPNCDRDMEIV